MATKRILIADDSLTIQKAFAMTFAGEDVTLLAARSADEGLTIARQARPELVIADAVMPGRSGYELCSAIKADPALRGVPVYILASSQNPYDEVRGRQSGADGQFIKPFESVSFVEKVKEAIAKGATAPAPLPAAPVTPAPVLRGSPSSTLIGAGRPAPAFAPAAGVPLASADPDASGDYGEITIEESGPQRSPSPTAQVAVSAAAAAAAAASEITPPPVMPLAAPRPAVPLGTAVAGAGNLRPSLIPGLRPGAAPPPARPGTTMPARPLAAPGFTAHPQNATPSPGASGVGRLPTPFQVPTLRPPYPQNAQLAGGPARTLVGLPASAATPAARFGAPTAPARPPTQPVRPLDGISRTPAPLFPATPLNVAAVGSKIDQKMNSLAARGPEYEAIAKLSREIIEKIVWEVVPELAEVIIREELQKRGRV